jgi:hypothetical protein
VIRPRVLVVDAEVEQLRLHRRIAVTIGGGVDAAVEFPIDVKPSRRA